MGIYRDDKDTINNDQFKNLVKNRNKKCYNSQHCTLASKRRAQFLFVKSQLLYIYSIPFIEKQKFSLIYIHTFIDGYKKNILIKLKYRDAQHKQSIIVNRI